MQTSILREKLKGAMSKTEKKLGRDPAGLARNRELIDYWNSLNLHPCKLHTRALKRFLNAVSKLRRGILFADNETFEEYADKAFSEEEIRMAMYRFSIAAHDVTYMPREKERFRKTPLHVFLFNPYAQTKIMKSLFLFFFENPPKKILTDENVDLSQKLLNMYRKKILLNESAELKSSDVDRFVLASNRLTDFLKQYEKRFRVYTKITNMTAAEWLFDAVTSNAPAENILPGLFCSDKTFLTRLPSYLKRIGVING